MRVRLAKLDAIRAAGGDPYPVGFPRTAAIAEVRDRFGGLAPGAATGERVGIAGRVMLSRTSGKLCFAMVRDGTGELQVMVSLDRVGEEALAAWKRDVDLGDQVGVTGEVISSRRGELSVLADSFAITAKALRPLPDKHAGLADPGSRVRQRYLDLIVNPEARRMAELRGAVTRSLREELHRRGFLEAETPVLQVLHGGANARPFITHINAYDMDLYLRIALELYLKRLIVGGIEKVYEIGRIFRNEGADATHNPEFTMLELYQAYADYDSMATLTRELIQAAARDALGSTVLRRPDGSEHDIGGQWQHKTVHGAVSEALGEEVTPDTSEERLRKLAASRASTWRRAGVAARSCWRCTSTWPSAGPCCRRSTGTSRSRWLRSPGRTARIPGSPRNGTWSRSAPRSRPPTPSSPTRPSSGPGSPRSPCSRRAATPRPCSWTRISCGPSSTACRRPAGWGWAPTGC